jgi:GT2 family glycosyltransferase
LPDVAPAPQISVVVPTRGRPAALATCLSALERSTLGPDRMEVVVVGDGEDVARPPSGRIPVRFLSQPRRGPAAARNLGARDARARVLAFTDDDCAPARAWAERMLAHVRERPDAVVGGRVSNALPENPWSAASHLVLDVVIDMHAAPGVPGFAPTSNLALTRELFHELGGFDERFPSAAAEDREFCHRSFASGHPFVLAAEARVDHFHELDARSFLRQSIAYGRGEVTYQAVASARGAPDPARGFYPRLARAAIGLGARRGVRVAWRAMVGQVAFNAAYWAGRLRAAR